MNHIKKYHYSIYNKSGKLVYQKNNVHEKEIQIQIEDFMNGIYIVECVDDANQHFKNKVLVHH